MFAQSAARTFGVKTDESEGRRRYEALAHHACDFILEQSNQVAAVLAVAAFGESARELEWTARSEVIFRPHREDAGGADQPIGAGKDRRADIVIEHRSSPSAAQRLVIELKMRAQLRPGQAVDNLAYAKSGGGAGKLWVITPAIQKESVKHDLSAFHEDVTVHSWDDLAGIGKLGPKKHLWSALNHYVNKLIDQETLEDVTCLASAIVAREFQELLRVFVCISKTPKFSRLSDYLGQPIWLQKGATPNKGKGNWGVDFSYVRFDIPRASAHTPIWFSRQHKESIREYSSWQSSQIGASPSQEQLMAVLESYSRSSPDPHARIADDLIEGIYGKEATVQFENARKILFAAMGRVRDILVDVETWHKLGFKAIAEDKIRFGFANPELGLKVWMGPPSQQLTDWGELGIWINDERVWQADDQTGRRLQVDEYVDLVVEKLTAYLSERGFYPTVDRSGE